MDDEPLWYDEMALPVLLDLSRRTYGAALRRALAEHGFDDMPRLGSRLVGGVARNGSGMSEFSRVLGTSKQAASQLVDTLVTRGYVERTPDTDDRRRLVVTLSARGEAAADVIREAMDATDAALVEAVGTEALAVTRATLGRLAEMGAED